MKKIQSLFALSLCFVLAGCSSPKPQPVETKDSLTFIMTKSEVHVRATSKVITGAISIPETYKGLPVTFIIANGFYNCKNVTKLTLPKTIQNIDVNAFYGCSSLKEVSIPNDSYLTNISYRCFAKSGLETISLPDRLLTIKEYAFEGCSNLTKVNIKETSNLISLGDYAFKMCDKLESFYIPKQLNSFQPNVFEGCSSLSSIDVSSENQAFSTQDGIVYNANKSKMLIVPKQISGNITLPDNLEEIATGCFAYCDKITSVVFPEKVTSIPSNCFESCEKLLTVSFLGDIEEVGERAFDNCRSLLGINLGNSLINIGDYAFANCTSLESISLPESLEYLGAGAFKNCLSLTSLDIDEECQIEAFNEEVFAGCSSLKEIFIPKFIKAIHSTSFDDMHSLEQFVSQSENKVYETIEGVLFTNKGQTLLRYPEGKKDIVYRIPDRVKSLKMDSFKNNTYIEEIGFMYDPHLVSYPNYTFSGCLNLKKVAIPKSMTTVMLLAFDNCPKLANITVNVANMVYASYQGVLYNRTKSAVIFVPEAIEGHLDIAKEVETLEEFNISELKYLNTLGFQKDSKLTTLMQYSITSCPELYCITLPVSLMKIEEKAISDLENLDDIFFDGTVEQFKSIDKADGWIYGTNVQRVECSDGFYAL